MSNISRLMSLAAAGSGGAPTEFGQAYGGGYYAGNIVQGGIEYYVIVAPKASGESSSLAYKTSNTASPSAAFTLNNGPAASASMNSSDYPAAQFCEGLTINDYSDWYLPARDELELCYRNLKPASGSNDTTSRQMPNWTAPEGPDQSGDTEGINRNSNPTGAAYTSGNPSQTQATEFQSGGAEAFSLGNRLVAYWSASPKNTPTTAWAICFHNGGPQQYDGKTNTYRVRAVRREPV